MSRPAGLQFFDLRAESFQADPFPVLREMNEAGPLVEIRLPIIGRVPTVTTHAAVTEFLRDQDRFVRDPRNAGRKSIPGLSWWMPSTLRTLSENMLGRDGEDHRRLRTLVEKAFTRQVVEDLRPRIRTLADELIDEAVAGAAADAIDVHATLSRHLPLAVICELLGLPSDDRHRFVSWAKRISEVRSAWGLARVVPGIWKIVRYLNRQFELQRQEPRGGLLSALIEVEESGDRLSATELTAMAFLLLVAGHETTSHLITTGLLCLLQHPAQKRQLMSDWTVAETAVDELLRFMSPVQICKPRFVSESQACFGRELSRGTMLIGLLAAANCDPAEFPEPEKLDLQREPNRHVTFGFGPHVCLGLKLARAEAAIAFEAVLTRFPELELAYDGQRRLPWGNRIGMRTLSELSVRLNTEAA